MTAVPAFEGNPADNGPTCDSQGPQPSCGQPIHPGNGNMWHTESDYAFSRTPGSLALVRTYNSSPFNWDARVARQFGVRWTHSFDAVITPETLDQQGVCWRRTDTGHIWCESSIPTLTAGALPQAISLLRGDGKKYLFNRNGLSWSSQSTSANGRLSAQYNTDHTAITAYHYVSDSDDATELYDGISGRLYTRTTPAGLTTHLVYSDGTTNDTRLGKLATADAPACAHVHPGPVLPPGRLLCVADSWGRQLNFEYDDKGHIIKLYDPADQVTLYEYDGPSGGCTTPDPANLACSAGNLTRVTYSDGASRTYHYNEAAHINDGAACPNLSPVSLGFGHLRNALTAVVDENGTRHLTWTYDCQGRATASLVGTYADKVTLAYDAYASDGTASTTVTHTVGDPAHPQTTVRRYGYKMVLGRAKNTGIDGPCVECGNAKTRSYDPSGNLATRTDWNGTKTCFSYDTTRNLETVRMEGTPEATTCGTSLAATTLAAPIRKISTQWHASYRLPTAIAEPYKRTTFSYDDKGNLLARTEQATTDSTGIQAFNATTSGGTHTWRYTYNDIGQVLTATDPLGAITAYTYDEFGNLATVTDTAGQVTTLSHYDANGHVGKIVDSNGIVTTLTYSPRGWLVAKTTGDDTTLYDYDGVGQLTTVTLHDGSSLYYSYDDAHRLTTMADSYGNRIAYTLDLRGNRMAEHITDPDGTLTRQTSRVYNTLSRLQQATGERQ